MSCGKADGVLVVSNRARSSERDWRVSGGRGSSHSNDF